jgi:hypothetical protein
MSSLEPEVKDFLKKIVSSVFLGLVWLMLSMTFGIYFGFIFIEEKISAANILFYSIFFISFIFLIRFYVKTWKKKFPHG